MKKKINLEEKMMYDPAIATIAIENWSEIEKIVMTNPKNLKAEEIV